MVETDPLAPIYVLAGDHPLLIDRALAEIRDAALPATARAFNYDVVEGKPVAARVVSLCRTLPMMAARRVVYVRDLAPIPADEHDVLIEYLADPNPTTVLVATTSKLDKRIKLYAQLAKRGFLHVLEAPRQLAPWLRNEAKLRGVELDAAAVQRLIDTVGDDLSRLALVVEQLGLYAGGRAVTADDVDDLVADTRERSVFELTDALGAADTPRALVAVAALCDQRESAVGVVVMLARHVRNLSQLHALRAQGVPRGSWVGQLGVPPFVLDKLIAQARNYTPVTLGAATERLAFADRALKGDLTLPDGAPYTGPAVKALGRDLAERVILEDCVRAICGSALAG
jgi:DNA polymerase-3 subunit delta